MFENKSNGSSMVVDRSDCPGVYPASSRQKTGCCPTSRSRSFLQWTAVLTSMGLAVPYVSAASVEEVIVTARKHEESAQSLSAPITAVSADRLQSGGVSEIRDLQRLVPSLNIGEVVGLMKTTVRGLGNTSNVRGEDSEVVMHVDGAVVSRQELYSMAYFDLERIEVLRGPQGTLYGRNSTGGTLDLITRKPTQEFEGYLNLTLGNYNLTKIETAVSGSLADKIQGRFALQSVQRDGFGKNITTGHDIDDERRWAARLHLNFDITDDIQFLLSNEYATENDAAGLLSFLRVSYPNNQSSPTLGAVGQGGYSDPESRDATSYFDPQLQRKTWSTTGTLDWRLDDRFSIKNIFNHRGMHFYMAQDLGLSSNISSPTINGFPTAAVGVTLDDHQYSEEFQFIHDGDVLGRNLNAVAGVFLFKEHLNGSTNVGMFPQSGLRAILIGDADTKAEAGFWNASYDITDLFSLRAGGRLTHESREIENHTIVPPTLVITPAIANDEKSFKKYTGEYGIDFHATEDILMYYTYSQGFRSGAGLIMQSDSDIIKPTTVENNEIGIKTQWLDHSLQLNVAVYKMDIKNLQRTKAYPNAASAVGFSTRFQNAAELNVKGVEFDSNWAVTDKLRVSAAVNYVDAKFGDYLSQDQLSPLFVTTPLAAFVQVEGNRPALSPLWKGNFHAEYDFELHSGVLTAGMDASYTDKQYFDEFNRAPFVEDAYTLYDASLAYKPTEGKWKLTAWGRNLTNEKQIADTSISGLSRTLSKTFNKPFTFGLSLDMKF